MTVSRNRSGDGGTGRPNTGRCGFQARRYEFQRIWQETIVIIIGAFVVSDVAVALHSQEIIPNKFLLPATGALPGKKNRSAIA